MKLGIATHYTQATCKAITEKSGVSLLESKRQDQIWMQLNNQVIETLGFQEPFVNLYLH